MKMWKMEFNVKSEKWKVEFFDHLSNISNSQKSQTNSKETNKYKLTIEI